MNAKRRFLIVLPIIYILRACRTFIPSLNPTPTDTLVGIIPTENHPLTPSSTFASIPFGTPTNLPPDLNSSVKVSTSSPTSILIPNIAISGEFDEYSLNNDLTLIAAFQYLSKQ